MRTIFLLLTIILGQIFFTVAYAAPAQVVIIRHGEKPSIGNELNTEGWQRANALPLFFETNKTVNIFGTPVAIYAGAPNKPGSSVRSIETITPYANALNLSVDSHYITDDWSSMVSEVMTNNAYNGKTVIICWEHKVIPEMAQMFGATNAPQTWDGNVFDRVWVIRLTDNQVSFQNLPQHLLPNDSTN